MRKLLVLLTAVCGVTWGTAIYLLLKPAPASVAIPMPTLMVLPSLTPSSTATETPTATFTFTPSSTPSATGTPAPTETPTLSTRVLAIRGGVFGGSIDVTPTLFSSALVMLPAPPLPLEPLLDATNAAPPYEGWYSFESDNPNVYYSAPWEPRLVPEASRGQYHRTENVSSRAYFTFEGEGLRIRYVAARNMGMFQVIVDGIMLDTIDAYAPELRYPATQIYTLTRGTHQLELRPTGTKNEQSEGRVTALDAVQVYRGDPNTLIVTPSLSTPTATPTPRQAAHVELVAAPPTLQATATPVAPSVITVSVLIAYDENGNGAVDPAEGVRDMSVRLVEAGTNRVIGQSLTDVRGYAELEVVTSAAARVVVPYLGKVWEVAGGRIGSAPTFTLLIDPANQPGLIP